MSIVIDEPLADAAEIRSAMEFYADQEWTDGLPVVPVTESYLNEFLATTKRDPEEVLFAIPHLNRECTVRLAAINAAMAGCRPDYFPVVVAAWDAIAKEPYPKRGIWQSTTGTAPLLIVNGPVRARIGLNSQGNVFGLQPHQLDQATQGTLAKYSACIAENEEESPWAPLHVEYGLDPADSAVTALVVRSCMHIEARHTRVPEQLALDLANTVRRTGALIHETTSALVVLGPEHAQVLAEAGWSKDDVRQAIYDRAVNSRADLVAVGKEAISRHTRWRVPADHPDAIPDRASQGETPDQVPALISPNAILIAVAGARNAGVSTVIETFGVRGDTPSSIARVAEPGA